MKVNWTVRLKNKTFWMTMIPAVIILVQTVANALGYALDLGKVGNDILAVVEALFVVLAILGIVNDPTTAGFISDSDQAMTYEKPKE